MSAALVSSAEEQLQGHHEGSLEYLESLFGDLNRRQEDFLQLDSVFEAFQQTNMFRGQHFKLVDICSSASVKRYFRFEHLGIPYLATVETWQAPEREYIVLRLPNYGYSYVSAAGQAFYRHRCHGWVQLNGTLAMEFFPRLCQQVVPAKFTSVGFTYNEAHNRIDIMLSREDDGAGLIIAFEPGYPYTDLVQMPMPRRR
ncbi:hypothetical protein HXX76_009501 [Chlamydomonas incerta]|uniref:Uncharacterized protein n=1 Tax=Chlamydomonas incerta TaxID=51695 RepID=A0A835VW19_CHLIN|nr:hypothetical protein HXX76_009501 [Chlamydomonas incerta]|eukprot:KAG2431487.1 hypothetical protein HXX76_009501 [Chlamydomonas incerta]